MLPGFRFLFAATVLTISMLVFGLGAAALLRAAHEEFASLPSRPGAPEPKFAQPLESSTPALAMLRVETAPPDQNQTPDPVPASAAPAEPEDTTPAETAKSEIPASAPPETPASVDTPAPADKAMIAATEQGPPPTEPAATPPAPEQPIAAATAEAASLATKIATLGDPPVAIEAEPKAASTRSDRSVVRKRNQARRTRERHRLTRARQTAVQTSPADAFSQPTITTRSR